MAPAQKRIFGGNRGRTGIFEGSAAPPPHALHALCCPQHSRKSGLDAHVIVHVVYSIRPSAVGYTGTNREGRGSLGTACTAGESWEAAENPKR
jgi:hypothetical protein